MSNNIFKTRKEHRIAEWDSSYEFDLEYAQCPVCNRWFTHFTPGDFRGLLMHIVKWAKKESTAKALGEISHIPHLDFYKEHSEPVDAIPRNREWKI